MTTAIELHTRECTTSEIQMRGRLQGGDPAKAPLASPVLLDGFTQVLGPEIGPKCRGEVELRVRGLPKKKIADAEFAGCPDDQIGIGQVPGKEVRLEGRLVNRLGRDS